MECGMVENVLMDFLENKLDKDQTALVAAHLRKCPGCKRLHEKIEGLILRLPDLAAEVPFFLENRLYNIPERAEKRREIQLNFPKWAAAVVGTVVLFSNLFYFTNIYPPANKGIHSLVSHVERIIVRTGGWIERIRESKDLLIFTFFNKKSLEIKEGETDKRKLTLKSILDEGGKNV